MNNGTKTVECRELTDTEVDSVAGGSLASIFGSILGDAVVGGGAAHSKQENRPSLTNTAPY